MWRLGLRVLHVIDSLIQAGAEALVKDMVPRMRAAGADVTVAVLKELNCPFERELREKRTLRSCPLHGEASIRPRMCSP